MNEYTHHHRQLSDEDLVRIAYFGVGKYEMKARDSAKAVLQERPLMPQQIEDLKEEVKKLEKIERNQKLTAANEKYGIVDFLIDVVFFWR